jgi:tripartite-type tricarboxylate transporter receptor subunit TctC
MTEAHKPWRGSAAAGVLLASLMAATGAAAQSYPSGPVKVVVPFGAGGATDILARIFSDRLQQGLGQSFTVENRGGAAGQIAAAAVARSPADGSTLMFTTAAPITVAPLMNDKVTYDPRKDIVPIAVVAVQPVWLVVNAASPLKSAADIVQKAKETPGKLTYGTSGVGTELHLAAEAVSRSAGIRMVHVPFRGGGDVIAALMGQQIDFAALSTASIAGALRQGTLRALAVSSPQRMADFPDVPTFAEIGHAKATMLPWWGMMAPAGTPRPAIERLTQELEKATKDAAVRERMKAAFVQIDFAGPQEFARRIEAETSLYGDIIRSANIKFGQ